MSNVEKLDLIEVEPLARTDTFECLFQTVKREIAQISDDIVETGGFLAMDSVPEVEPD